MRADSLRTASCLMLALDVEDSADAERIVGTYREFIDAVKLGTTLLVNPSGGIELISKIKHFGLPVLVDAKLKDVQHVLLSTARSYRAHGATAVTCWSDIGKKTLNFCIDSLKNEIELVVLTALTSLPYEEIEQLAKEHIITAVECGCQCIQIPGNYPDLILWARDRIPSDVLIVSCGIGRQGGRVGDAIKCGADYEIIGRHILDSADMLQAFKDSSKIIRENLGYRSYVN